MDSKDYEAINEAVNAVFFDGRSQSNPVYLDLEDEERHEIANLLSCYPEEFDQELGSCVCSTLSWDETNIYSWHLANMKNWLNSGHEELPPFSALLLALSLAAEHMRKEGDYSANNYYQRLIELLGATGSAKKDKLSTAGKYTRVFWKALNMWLTSNDHAYGRPTAKQVNNWTYVSYALSQSLVREADRKRFHLMFNTYGLSPHDNLTESEMALYLHEWMASNGASAWLKKLWEGAALRNRVTSAAIDELESWGGTLEVSDTNIESTRKLGWVASVQSFPRPRILLYLSTIINDLDVETELSLPPDSLNLAIKAFEKCNGKIWLSLLRGTDLVFVDPVNKLNLDAMLQATFELVSEDRKSRIERQARPVIPMIMLESSPYFREVPRISLHVNHMLLCHENWKDMIKDYLDRYARPGYTVMTADRATGLPSPWISIHNVELLKVPNDPIHDNLQCLVPLAEGTNIVCTGGLKLSNSIWHSVAPPSVYASDESGLLDVFLKINSIDRVAKILAKLDASTYDPEFLEKLGFSLGGGNFILIAARGKSKKVEKEISFRTAAIPRKLLPFKDVELHYRFGNDNDRGWGFSAVDIKQGSSGPVTLRGMILTGDVEIKELDTNKANALDDLQDIDNDEEDSDGYDLSSVEGFAESCILRGYHYWICPPFEGGNPHNTSRLMTCRDCGNSVFSRKNKAVEKDAPNEDELPPIRAIVSQTERPKSKITPEAVLDAICYVGVGTWRKLETLISSMVEAPIQVNEFAKKLIDRGYIDVMLDENNRRPRSWSCAPPCLVYTSAKTCFMSGFTNETLLQEISEVLSPKKYFELEEARDLVPPIYAWEAKNTDLEELQSVFSGLTDPLGRELKVVNSPSRAIIHAMPSISQISVLFNAIHVEGGEIEKFDPRTGRWLSSEITGEGAYRTTFAGRRYFFRDSMGHSYESSFELVKLLAARNQNIKLHGHDQEKDVFECVLGCEPPGLYRRALVACSGKSPGIKSGKVQYYDVPENIAAELIYKLYN